MEINITRFVQNEDPFPYSHSQHEGGPLAGPNTWNNALREAESAPLLTTEDELDALRAWAKATGAWDEAERNAWSADQCNALFIQLISGDIREMNLDECELDEFDWDAYEERCQEGTIAGNIFKGTDGEIYYSLSE